MPATPYNPTGAYQPASTLTPPALFAWPPRPLAALKYFSVETDRWLCDMFDLCLPETTTRH